MVQKMKEKMENQRKLSNVQKLVREKIMQSMEDVSTEKGRFSGTVVAKTTSQIFTTVV